jgi:CRISPR-associated protein Cas1
VLLRRAQYRRADDEAGSVAVARVVVAAKMTNARSVLQRTLRDHPDSAGAQAVQSAVVRLDQLQGELSPDLALETLRGMEGDAAKTYFGAFDHLITSQKEDFFFHGRSRRPPMDRVNCLLSFLYTLLAHDASGALQATGLDVQVGFLHRERPGRPALALDLMEEFRPFLADRLALSMVNLRQIQAGGFKTSESGAVLMDDATRKELLIAYQKRKQEEIIHPFLEKKTTVGLLVHIQALLLARFLRGDLDSYPPFIWR